MSAESDRSFSELLRDIAANVEQIVRSEFLLAKAELKEQAVRVMKSAPLLVSGAVLSLYALGFLLLFCVYALALVLPTWAAALIVGAGIGMIAVVLLGIGVRQVMRVSPPTRTIQSVKENLQWAKRQIK